MRYSKTRPDSVDRQTASDLSPDGYAQSPAYRHRLNIGQRSRKKPTRERSRSRDRDQREQREREAAFSARRPAAHVDLDEVPEPLELEPSSEASSAPSGHHAANFFSRNAINRQSLAFTLASTPTAAAASTATTIGIFSLAPTGLGMPSPRNAAGTAEAATLAAPEITHGPSEPSAKAVLELSKLTL